MRYVARARVPGQAPFIVVPLPTILGAWLYLAWDRFNAELDCDHGTCEEVIKTLVAQDHCGQVHAHDPGGDTRGIMYSVDIAL